MNTNSKNVKNEHNLLNSFVECKGNLNYGSFSYTCPWCLEEIMFFSVYMPTIDISYCRNCQKDIVVEKDGNEYRIKKYVR